MDELARFRAWVAEEDALENEEDDDDDECAGCVSYDECFKEDVNNENKN